MISDPQYRQTWANVEKHNATELETFRDKPAWGLYYEPIGDYRDGKVYDFHTGQEITAPQSQNNSTLTKPDDPTLLVPHSDRQTIEKNRTKDRSMAAIATQFIGFSAQTTPDAPSSTRDYQQAWERYGLANTGNYSPVDTIMVSGSGPWRGVTEEQIQSVFQQSYVPLLSEAISSGANFVVGEAPGTDRLVRDYLQANNYLLVNTTEGYALAKPITPSQSLENPTPLDARQVQVQRSQMVIPIIMDYLKVKGKSFVQGETFTAFWDASNGILHLLSNADNEPKLTAKYLGKDQGDKPLWEISPLVHEQEGKLTPRLSEGDVELLKTHQPKIEKLLLAQQKQQTQRRI
jgi:hypothetical protein